MSTVKFLVSAVATLQLSSATTLAYPNQLGTVLTYTNPNAPQAPFPRKQPETPSFTTNLILTGANAATDPIILPIEPRPNPNPNPEPRPDPRPATPGQPQPPRAEPKPDPKGQPPKEQPPVSAAARSDTSTYFDKQREKHEWDRSGKYRAGKFDTKMGSLNTQFQIAVALLLAFCVGMTLIKWCFCTHKKDYTPGKRDSQSAVTDNDIDWSDDTDLEDIEEPNVEIDVVSVFPRQNKKGMEPVPDNSVLDDDFDIQEEEVERDDDDEDDEESDVGVEMTDDETREIMREFRDSDEEYAE